MSALVPSRKPVALATTVGLVLGSAAVLAGSLGTAAVSAPPEGDCATPFPVAELVPGEVVTGLTVARGVTPAPFTGEVLGVVDNGIAPGIDMVMVDLTSPDLDRVGAIWQGMSGSPVHAPDGRLIGAVSYGLAAGPSQIAGVTPFEAMDDYAVPLTAAATVKVDKAAARALAAHSDFSVARAARGFRQLPVQLSVRGIDPRAASRMVKRKYLTSPLAGLGGTARASVAADTVVAGGNLGASASYGEISTSAVGTVTSVCKGRVFGMGHPLGYLGETSLSMHPASTVYVQPDPGGTAFKVANLGAPIGTVDVDAMAGITGSLGALPPGTVLTSSATYRSRSHTGTSTVTVPQFLAETAYMQLASSLDRAVDGTMAGNAEIAWTLEAISARGVPVTLTLTDRYTAEEDVAFEAGGELSDLAYAVSAIRGARVTRITTDAKVTKDDTSLRIKKVKRLKKKKWVTVKGRIPVKAGSTLTLRVVLVGSDRTIVRKVSVKVPKRLKGERSEVEVIGGADHFVEEGGFASLTGIRKYLAGTVRNDQVAASITVPKGDGVVTKTTRSVPAPLQVAGGKRVRIKVR